MSSFSACPRCGVRLSAPSMAYHQQLCGKSSSVRDANNNSNGGGHGDGITTQNQQNLRPQQQQQLQQQNHHIDMYASSNGTPQQISTPGARRRLDASELNALRQEVYGGAVHPMQAAGPASMNRHADERRSPSSSNARRRDADDEQYEEFPPPKPSARRAQPFNNTDEEEYGAPATSSRSVPQPSAARRDREEQHALASTVSHQLQELSQDLQSHVDYCKKEFLHLENLTARHKIQRADDQAMREEMRRLADELLLLRREFKDMSMENERLRDEVRKLKAERSVIAADSDFIELRNEVTRIKTQLDTTNREAYANIREMRLLKDESSEEVAAVKKECRQALRELELVHEELGSIKRKLGATTSLESNNNNNGSSSGINIAVGRQHNGPRTESQLQADASGTTRPNINLTVQHHSSATSGGGGASSFPRRSPSGGSAAVPSTAGRKYRSTSNNSYTSDYLSVDEPEESQRSTVPQPQQHQQSGGAFRKGSNNYDTPTTTFALDSSMRRDTEDMITKAMQQQKRPSAVVSSRSLSRGTDDYEAHQRRAGSSSPESGPVAPRSAPVAHVSLRSR